MDKTQIIEKFNKLIDEITDSVKTLTEVPKEEDAVKLMQATLEDGVIVEYELLEVDYLINIVSEDGTLTPLPTGEYVIEGINVMIEDGMIKEVKEIEKEVEPKEVEVEQTVEVKASVEVKEVELAKEEIEEVEVKTSEEDFAVKLAEKQSEMQADFNKQIAEKELNFKNQLKELAEDVKLSNIVQAPVETKTVEGPVSVKDRMIYKMKINKSK